MVDKEKLKEIKKAEKSIEKRKEKAKKEEELTQIPEPEQD